jgi:serine O-acetyltransferase
MPGARDPDWQADLARIDAPRAFLKEQSLWAIWVYRFGRRVDARPAGLRRHLFSRLYWLLFRIVETVTGISLPKSCVIGKGLRIWHFGGVFLNGDAVLGENCTLRQGVTIGNREEGGGSPHIGDNVEFGAYAQVLGPVRIGDGRGAGRHTGRCDGGRTAGACREQTYRQDADSIRRRHPVHKIRRMAWQRLMS